MAFVVPNSEDGTKYDLYIGAAGGVIANSNSRLLFFNMRALENINFNNNFDTSNVEIMQWMFAGSNSLTTLDLSSFDTSNVYNMGGMCSSWDPIEGNFGTSSLQNIIFGENFKTSNVTYMYHMFNECSNLKELNLCSFNTSKVTDMIEVFRNTQNIENIYVGDGFITAKADTTNMFSGSGVSEVTTRMCN